MEQLVGLIRDHFWALWWLGVIWALSYSNRYVNVRGNP